MVGGMRVLVSRRQIPPQRSNLAPANRELREAIKGPKPKPFGIRRPFHKESQDPLIKKFVELCLEGEIPEYVTPRTALYDTMLPKRRVDSQLTRGIMVGYKFANQQREAKHTLAQAYPNNIITILNSTTIINNQTIGLTLISEELELEHDIVDAVMGEIGVHKPKKHQFPVHVSLGSAPHFISRFDEEIMTKVLDRELPIGEQVTLLPLEFYPKDEAARA